MAGGINLKISLLLRILAFNPAQSDMPDQILGPGLTIHYLDLNPRGFPCVMLLHGLGATCASWQLQTPALVEEGYRVVAPDMRGFGKSSYPGGKNDPKIMANDISDLCDMLDLHELHVVGISLGGTVALEFTLANPATVRSLVITNSFARDRLSAPWKHLIKDVMPAMKTPTENRPIITAPPGPGCSLPFARPGTAFMVRPQRRRLSPGSAAAPT